MNANELIDSYVGDVARHLPRNQREDVAFELSALLRDELQAKAEAAGREADAAMAQALLADFGRPADVAARYRPTVDLIDPADTRSFLRISAIGVAIWWVLGLAAVVTQRAGEPGGIAGFGDVLYVLQDWWLGSALAAFWWPGFLLVWFAIAAWSRRRWPRKAAWSPRPTESDRVNRFAYATAVAAMILGLAMLLQPSRLLDLVFNGRAAPEAYAALTYDQNFLALRAPLLMALLIANVAIYATVAVRGRWTALLRRIEIAIHSALCVVMAWVVLDGRVVQAEPSDEMIKGFLGLLLLVTVIDLGRRVLRQRGRVRPPAALSTSRASS